MSEMPQGPSTGMINSMLDAGGGGGGAGGAPSFLCMWLPTLEGKRLANSIPEWLSWGADKKMVPGADSVKYLPVCAPGFFNIPGLAAVWDAIFSDSSITPLAEGLEELAPDDLDAVRQMLAGTGVSLGHDEEDQFRMRIAGLSAKNAQMLHSDSMSIG